MSHYAALDPFVRNPFFRQRKKEQGGAYKNINSTCLSCTGSSAQGKKQAKICFHLENLILKTILLIAVPAMDFTCSTQHLQQYRPEGHISVSV